MWALGALAKLEQQPLRVLQTQSSDVARGDGPESTFKRIFVL